MRMENGTRRGEVRAGSSDMEARITWWFFGCSLAASTLLSGVISIVYFVELFSKINTDASINPTATRTFLWAIATAGLLLFTIKGKSLIALASRKGRFLGVFLVLSILNVGLLVPELSLRAMDFRYESGVQFGYPRPEQFYSFEYDTERFWIFDRSLSQVNSDGFWEKEFAPKAPDSWRVVFIGDSCTHQGYPKQVEELLNSVPPDGLQRVETLNLAIPGYTSHQGRIVAEKFAAELDADAAVVFFGWNDHWQAYGTTDADKKIRAPESSSVLTDILGRLRGVQFLAWLLAKPIPPLPDPRVNLKDYERNLCAIAESFKATGTPVLFATAPTSHYAFGFPEKLLELGFAPSKSEAIEKHRRYNKTVRKVAKDNDCLLVELETAMSKPDLAKRCFMKDGIHFTQEGLGEVAVRITDTLKNLPDTKLKIAGDREAGM